MKHGNFVKIIAVIAVLAMTLTAFAACGGSLKLESFTVDRTTIKTSYIVGEAVDFSGIKAYAKYSDESLNKTYTYDELTITYADDITATVGEKEVSVSFNDPNLNKKQETKVKITVTSGEDDGSPLIAVQFEKPQSMTQFDSSNSDAGKLAYGDAGFFAQFATGSKTYVIGNENEFKLNPQFAVLADDDSVRELNDFYSVVEISIEKDGAYVALTKKAGEGNSVSYYDGETLIATVDTYKGSYQFANDAAGKKVKISVLPSEDRYITTTPFNPVVVEANVIAAYNVYEAWQLAVIDNVNDEWNDIKTAHGISDLTVSGVVLHANIKLTADDVPATYFYTTDKDVVYTNATNPTETVTVPAGTKFLKDWTQIYERHDKGSFVIEGNFFALNAREFPLVASPAVFGKDAEKDYGSDFSNSTLFVFETQDRYAYEDNPNPADVLNLTINNLAINGNAKRDNLVDANENLASAGGLIFIKNDIGSECAINNMIGNSTFITYFPTGGGNMTVSNSKCFDSYQNVAFCWGESAFTVDKSCFEGCGGPVIIASSVIDDGRHPTVTVTDSIIKTSVTGEEIWFTAVNANSIVGSIKGLGQGLQMAGIGNIVDASGKMNVMGLLMASGDDAAQIVTGLGAQGAIIFDGDGMNRLQSAENIHWATLKQISEYAQAMGSQMPPFFTVTDANGAPQSIYFNGTTFVDLAGNALGTDASHAALVGAFASAETITLTQGGLSVVFELYHN